MVLQQSGGCLPRGQPPDFDVGEGKEPGFGTQHADPVDGPNALGDEVAALAADRGEPALLARIAAGEDLQRLLPG